MTTAQDQQSRYPAEFEKWARDRGLISSSHGLTTEWSSLGVALEAWQAARALPAGIEPVGWVDDGAIVFWENLPPADGSDLFTAAQVLAMGRVPIDLETVEMARALQKKLKTLRKKDVPMDAYVLLTDAQYVIERLLGTATHPTGD